MFKTLRSSSTKCTSPVKVFGRVCIASQLLCLGYKKEMDFRRLFLKN